jgi:ribosomal protein L37AE/L43A
MINAEEQRELHPLCPHCGQAMDRVVYTRIYVVLGKAFLWSCPHCQKVLGVTHRKGFWMG